MPRSGGEQDEAAVIIDVNAASSVACLRSLSKHGIRTVAASENEKAASFCSNFCNKSVVVPSPKGDIIAYKDALRSLAEHPQVGTIVPLREEDIYVLSKYKDEFEAHVGTPWPSFEKLQTVRDRIQLFDAAESAGISVPDTYLLDEFDEWDREMIIKSRYTIHIQGKESEYAPVTFLEPERPPNVEAVVSEMGHVPLIQEHMKGTEEYALFALYDRDGPVTTFQHRQIRGCNYSGGPSAYRVAIDDPELKEAGLSLLDHLNWYGLAMVEFKKDERTGEYKLMEINPRFWSSLPFTVQAGVDFPYYYWCQAMGRECSLRDDYQVGSGGHFLYGELMYLSSLFRDDISLTDRPPMAEAVRSVVVSLAKHPQFDYLALNDMCPFIRTLINNLDKVHVGSIGTKND